MSTTALPYTSFLSGLAAGAFNLTADPLKALLTTAAYTPNLDTHAVLSDVTNEVVGAGYTAGGKTLTGVAWVADSTNHWGSLTCDPATWTAASFTCRRLVLYKSTGSAATSRLIGVIDYGADQTAVAQDFTATFTDFVIRVKRAI